MQIDFANLKQAHLEQKEEIEEAVLRVCRNANYIMGKEVEALERVSRVCRGGSCDNLL